MHAPFILQQAADIAAGVQTAVPPTNTAQRVEWEWESENDE